ncbi:MAG TPA: cobalamin-independent methionine synthase II family protein [Candidatus Binataceae bacterium]|nr:cobalamin-independent methionine synthase II family protein [Candidatus Binataceae bacterium]
MKRSSERILTTHTGSLPRPDALMPLIEQKDSGTLRDKAAFDAAVKSAVGEIVHQQTANGVDIVNDGEVDKPSYATYPKDRLSGFGGVVEDFFSIGDLVDYPEYGERFFAGTTVSRLKRSACDGPVAYRDRAGLETEIANLKAAVAQAKPAEAFMSAASPGVISIFLPNRHYKTHEAYLTALADAMKVEYAAIHQAGFVLQVDCPDLAMGRHIQFPDASLAEFRKNIELHVETLNHALSGIPEDRVRLHLCWGNYEGPHHRDVPLRDILDIVLKAHAAGISYEASNPRHEHEWAVFKDVKLPAGKVLIPGVIDSVSNFIEHPELVAQRICNVARLVGRENVIAGTDCGFATFAGFHTVDPKITWAKFAAMAEGARLASKELW